ncbi:uncharacterized protein METZ01_LOCUS208291, partial [marine metagenome]
VNDKSTTQRLQSHDDNQTNLDNAPDGATENTGSAGAGQGRIEDS